MADNKKMSVADILAAARKADGGDAAAESAPVESAPTESTPAEKKSAAAGDPKPAKSASGGRLSVAEMMAMARGEKSGGEKKPAAKKPSAKPAANKPAAKAKPAAKTPAEPRDTASILAAAKKSSKAGPMSKAEAAAKTKANPKAKPKIVVPPMPERPAYARPVSTAKKGKGAANKERRDFFLWTGFGALAAVSGLFGLATLKFMFPNILREPPSKFKVGFPRCLSGGAGADQIQSPIWCLDCQPRVRR